MQQIFLRSVYLTVLVTVPTISADRILMYGQNTELSNRLFILMGISLIFWVGIIVYRKAIK
jgi:hypothetical protein